MELLRFDPSGAIHQEYGITETQIEQLKPSLTQVRDVVATIDPSEYHSGRIPADKQPLDARFMWLPEEQLAAYESKRENSELGRIFKLALRLHQSVDAVVVLGIGGSYMGARALMEAGCHPYHNELSRGRRGSKPRMYFEGNNVDNDASAALFDRLSDVRNEDSVARRWALCVISKSGGTLETAAAFRQYLSALEFQLGNEREKWLPELVVPVTGSKGKLFDLAQGLGCREIFEVPEGVGGRFSVLSAVGILPAAILGLDCMQLLKGAQAMTDHFRTAAYEENVVLQFVAVNHLLEKHRGANIRVLSIWTKALESVGLWYDQLLAESLGKAGRGATPLTTVNTRDLHSRHQQHQQGRCDKVYNNLIVRDYRADPLVIGHRKHDADGLNELATKTLPDIMRAAIQGTNDALHGDGRPTTDIVLPKISMDVLGQLFQMLMLATVVEGRLIGINPYGQPGVEQYKINMNRNLGRK
jgi:glucose-6-phosphate isomerase